MPTCSHNRMSSRPSASRQLSHERAIWPSCTTSAFRAKQKSAASGERLVTRDVRALARVAVAARLISATVVDPADGFDAEVAVEPRLVAGQLCLRAICVEAVVFRALGNVAPEAGMPRLVADVHPVLPGPADVVAAHHGARQHTASTAHEDRVPLGVADGVAGDHVAVAALDNDAAADPPASPNVGDAVSGDHVSIAGGDVDPDLAVSTAAVAPHLIAV